MLTPSDHFVCSSLQTCQLVHLTGVRGEKWEICLDLFYFKRWLGTTKQRLMDTWTSWRRPRERIWTLRTRMAWLPPYWLLSMDMWMLYSSYAAESKDDTLLSKCDLAQIVYILNLQVISSHLLLYCLVLHWNMFPVESRAGLTGIDQVWFSDWHRHFNYILYLLTEKTLIWHVLYFHILCLS